MALAMSLCVLAGAHAQNAERPHFEPGDVVFLFSLSKSGEILGVSGSRDFFAWREWNQAIDASDDVGLSQLRRQGKTAFLECGARAKVLKFHDGYKLGNDWVSDCYEVRLVTGDAKNEVWWVPTWDVRKIVTRFGPGITGDMDKPAEYAQAVLDSNKAIYKAMTRSAVKIGASRIRLPKGSRAASLKLERAAAEILKDMASTYERDAFELIEIFQDGDEQGWPRGQLTSEEIDKAKGKQSPTDRAAQKFKLGQVLEAKNPKGAIGYYEEVIKLAPDSAQAGKAEARIKALKSK